MATSVTFNGTSYSVPGNREPRGWGTSLTALIVDIANSSLSKAGGSFTLTADANLGATYGVVAKYIKSVSSNIAASGVVRLANTDKITFRNNANGADLSLGVSTSDRLQFESVNIPTVSSTDTLTNKTLVAANNTVTTAASGNLAATELNAALAELQTDIDGREPTITTLGINRGGTGQTTANAALNALLPTQTGNANKVLSTDGADASWAAVATTVTTTEGDMIYRDSSADTRLAGNTSARKKVLTQKGDGTDSAAPSWDFTIDDGLNVVGFVDTTNLGSNVTLTIDDNLDRSYVLAATRNITLPTTSIKKGMKVRLESRSTVELVVLASGGSVLNVANGCNREASITKGFVLLEALQDAPTTPAHWWVSEVYSYGSFTGTLTGVTTTPSQTFYYHRYNDRVTISPAGALTGTSNTTACTITGMPTHIRPTSTRKILNEVQNNGLPGAGLWEIASSGTITLRPDAAGSAFTASGTKGLGQGAEASYSMI